MKPRDVVVLLAVAAAAVWYFKRQAAAAAAAIASAPAAAGNAIANATFDFLNPSQMGETTFYTVTFPDGSRHAIGASTVNSMGTFFYKGYAYQLKTDANGQRIAVR